MSRVYLNPLLLVADKKVHISEDLESESLNATYLDIVSGKHFDPATVTLDNFRTQDISFELSLNIKIILEYYNTSGAKGKMSFEEFKFAFLTRELSLIRYGAIEYMNLIPLGQPYAGNLVWDHLFHLLELRRCRYRLSFDMPSFSRYLGIYSACVRKGIAIDASDRDLERFRHLLPRYEGIRTMLEKVYDLVTFNRAPPDSELAEYALPLLLSAERNDVANCAQAAKAIYDYLILPGDLHKALSFRFFDMMLDMDDSVEALPEERPVIQRDEAEGFYRDVLIRRIEEIVKIRNVFKRIFTMTEQVEVFDGDVDLRKQQRLYLDSLTGEEGQTFVQRRFKNTTMDVVILRDISFSTDLCKVEYGEAMIVILAALEGLPAVRTAQIDFSEQARVNKTFEQSVNQSAFVPDAFGGTRMADALELVDALSFKASKRLVFIASDGEIEDMDLCTPVMQRMTSDKHVRFLMLHLSPEIYGDKLEFGEHSVHCSFNRMDKAIFTLLLKVL